MVARHWRGWTKLQDADSYERLLKERVLPQLKAIEGYNGGYIFRKDGPQEVEFVVINFFESLEAVQRFAGSNYNVPVFEPDAKKLLCKLEPAATHYEVRANTMSLIP